MIYPQANAGGSGGKRVPRGAEKKVVIRKKGGGGGGKQQVVHWKQRNVKEGLVIVDEQQLTKLIKREPIEKFYTLDAEPFATGLFASVRRCVSRESGSTFAAKFSSRTRYGEDCSAEIHHEIALLSLCAPSRRIVRLHDVFATPKEIIIVMEFAPGGDLQTIIDDNLIPFEADVVNFVHQLVEGLAYLHERKIAHLDIKPQNLVMMADFPNCDIKLCDFEISRVILEGTEIREILGTPDYVAPEILHYEPITMAADMWSLGVTTYVLLTGFTPFGGETDQETFCNISRAQLDFPEELFEDVSADAQDFIQKLLVRDPGARPTAKELLRHRWLANRNAPKASTKAALPDTTNRATMSQKNLRKYLSKSREALFERVVQQQQHRNNDLRKSTLVSQYNKTRLCESHMSLVSKSRQDHTLNYLSPSFSRSREKLYGLRSLSKSHEGLDLLKMNSDGKLAAQASEGKQGGAKKYTKSTTADLSMLPLLRLQEVASSSESLEDSHKLCKNDSKTQKAVTDTLADNIVESRGNDVDDNKTTMKPNDMVQTELENCPHVPINESADTCDNTPAEVTQLNDSDRESTIKACVVLNNSGRRNVDEQSPNITSLNSKDAREFSRASSYLNKMSSERENANEKTLLEVSQINGNNSNKTVKMATLLINEPQETANHFGSTRESQKENENQVNVSSALFSITNGNEKNTNEDNIHNCVETNKTTSVSTLLSPQLLITSSESISNEVNKNKSKSVDMKLKDKPIVNTLFEPRQVTQNLNADMKIWKKADTQENKDVDYQRSVLDSNENESMDDVSRKSIEDTLELTNVSRSKDLAKETSYDAPQTMSTTSSTISNENQKSDEDEPKFSVAQLISAYNRHQDIVTQSSLAVTMTANDKDHKIPPLIFEDPSTKFPTGPKALRLFIRDIDIEPSKRTTKRNRTKSYMSRSSTKELDRSRSPSQELESNMISSVEEVHPTVEIRVQEETPTNEASENDFSSINIGDQHDTTYNVCNFVLKPPGNIVTQKPTSTTQNGITKRPEVTTSYLRSGSISSETSATSGCFTSESSGSASWEEISSKKEESQWIQKSVKSVGKSDGNPWGRLCTGSYTRAMEKFGGKDVNPGPVGIEEKCEAEKPTRKCSLTMICPPLSEEKTRRKSTATMQQS